MYSRVPRRQLSSVSLLFRTEWTILPRNSGLSTALSCSKAVPSFTPREYTGFTEVLLKKLPVLKEGS